MSIQDMSVSIPAILAGAVTAAYALMIFVAVVRLRKARRDPTFQSYRIAVIGPPGSGKTTAILCMLDQVRRLRDEGVVRLRGESTISRLEAGMDLLSRGRFPPPTPQDESLIYRMDYKSKTNAISEIVNALFGYSYHYRIEIADFAGEHVEEFFRKNSILKKRNLPDSFSIDASQNFLKWVSESDVCMMFLDEERILSDEEYAIDITNKYMSFWHRYLDLHVDRLAARAGRPVVVVYSKIDLDKKMGRSTGPHDSGEIQARIKGEMDNKFSRLISFLEANSAKVDSLGISVLLRDKNKERLGIGGLIDLTMPRRRV